MSLISRVTTWVTNQILTSSALNAEFNNVTNLLNNLDAATTSWTNVKTGSLSMTGNVTFDSATHGIVGASGTSAAAAGNVGEVLSASASSVSITTSVANITSLSVTAGVWIIFGTSSDNGTANGNVFIEIGISANSASFTGTTDGINSAFLTVSNGNGGGTITRVINQSTTATWYLVGTHSNGATNVSGSLKALRIA